MDGVRPVRGGMEALNGEHWTTEIFDGFPEPVLLLRAGRVAYRNQAAAGRFPGLREGDPVPPALEGLLDGAAPPAAAAGVLDGWSCTAALQAVGEDTLVVLRPRSWPEGRPGPDRLALQLRREVTTLSAAVQRLDPTEEVPSQERALRYLAVANQGIHRLLRLTDHLELTSGGAGELWRPQPLDLAGLCRELCEQVDGVCRLSGYHFSWELEQAGLLTMGEDRLLSRAILSLISNAMKAAGKTGSLGLRLSTRGGRAMVTVWNSGRPLKEEDLGRLFSAAYAAPLNPRQGLGLGLEVARNAAELHGGTLLAESRDGTTRCVLSLPVRRPEGEGPVRTPKLDMEGGFSALLVELSDVLPPEIYNCEDLQ